MIYRFDAFELDEDAFEPRRSGWSRSSSTFCGVSRVAPAGSQRATRRSRRFGAGGSSRRRRSRAASRRRAGPSAKAAREAVAADAGASVRRLLGFVERGFAGERIGPTLRALATVGLPEG